MFGSKKKDAAFFSAFSQHAAKSVEAAGMLVEMLRRLHAGNGSAPNWYRAPADGAIREADERTKQLYNEIKEAETAADGPARTRLAVRHAGSAAAVALAVFALGTTPPAEADARAGYAASASLRCRRNAKAPAPQCTNRSWSRWTDRPRRRPSP